MSEILDKIKDKAKEIKEAVTGEHAKQAGVIEEEKAKVKKAVEDVKRDLNPEKG
jgi:hypothetical protein